MHHAKPFVLLSSLVVVALGACGGGGGGNGMDADAAIPVVRAPELGTGDRSPTSVTFTEIAGASAKLKQPRDLDFNPRKSDELWVVNNGDESMSIIHDASQPTRTAENRKDGYALHFMANPAAISFGSDTTTIGLPGTFATCGESRNDYDHQAAPNDFMGPSLWSSDLTVFAAQNPNGLGSHLDMLHCSPLCMGIAHDSANVYWAFDGLASAIVKYDFKTDNGIGNDDHSDGAAWQFATGLVKYKAGVPSHLAFDAATGYLYIADTGNQRIARLDTHSGAAGRNMTPLERMSEYKLWDNATVDEIVAAGMLPAPSGIELHNGFLYVSDNQTGHISAFTPTGELVNDLDTGLGAGALSGMAFGPDGKLYFVNMLSNQVLRIDPK